MIYVAHFLIGLAGAGAGLIGRNWCRHRKHQIIVGLAVLIVESIVSVQVVG